MVAQKLRLSLKAYDPNPNDVTLSFDDKNCAVDSCSGASVSVEEYKTTPEGNPSEIYLKVIPDPIAFVMKFDEGKIMIEFKGNWAAFKVQTDAERQEAQTSLTQAVEEPVPLSEPEPAPVEVDNTPAFSTICFKVHFVEDDVDAHDIRMNWDMKELSTPAGASYTIVYQCDTAEKGREFVLAFPHPITGELFCIRGVVLKNGRITILNTDKFHMEHIQLYLTFYLKDPDQIAKILAEMEANPGYEIMILYKYGVFGESIDLSSFVPYISHVDKDKKPIKTKDKGDDDYIRKAREFQKKAEEKGKKGTEPPSDGKNWSCGRVKWELPKEEKKFRDVGKLTIPEFGSKDEGPHTQGVGKLQWGGFQGDEQKPVAKEKPKVGKLNIGAFGGASAGPKNPAPAKRSWKKKPSTNVKPAELINGAK